MRMGKLRILSLPAGGPTGTGGGRYVPRLPVHMCEPRPSPRGYDSLCRSGVLRAERWLLLQEGQAAQEPPPAPLSAAEAACVLGRPAPA